MTKKDFEAIAKVIYAARAAPQMSWEWRSGSESTREVITRWLADYFVTLNPRFDREKFHKAAMGEGE